jgi:hypothetical protein
MARKSRRRKPTARRENRPTTGGALVSRPID